MSELSRETATATASDTDAASPAGELLRQLRACGEAIAAIGAALHVPSTRLARAEAAERMELESIQQIESLAAIEPASVQSWFVTLGDDLAIDLYLRGQESDEPAPAAFLRHDDAPAATLAEFVTRASEELARSGTDLYIDVRVSAGKTRIAALARKLLAMRGDAAGGSDVIAETYVLAFYCGTAWQRLLRIEALGEWERLGIVAPGHRTFVVLCDRTGYVAGRALEIAGARTPYDPRWQTVSAAAWQRHCERAADVRAIWASETSETAAMPALALDSLHLDEREPGLTDMMQTMAELRSAVAALYLASAVTPEEPGHYILRFAGTRPAACHLPDADHSERKAEGALTHLAAWALASESADRLLIARESLAHELPAGKDVTLRQVDQAAEAADEAARANFALFLRKNTDRYFATRQQALDAVASYAAEVRGAVSTLTDSVVTTAYQTVGLLVGVIIAGVIQPQLSLGVQRFAAILYTLYVLVFVLGFLMSARWRQYQLDAADVDTRLRAMEELSEGERKRLLAQPARENAYFETYFRWSCAIYVALGAVGLIYFLLLWTPLATHFLPPGG